jgi:sortase A
MVRGLAAALVLAGLALLGVSAYQLWDRESHQVVEQRRLESALRAGGSTEGGKGRATGARTRAARGVAWGRLEIPEVGLSVVVEDGTDRPTLRRSVGHLPETAYPGEAGNVVFAGHRDGLFRPLKDVKAGQRLRITTTDGTFDYAVSTEVVEPDRVDRIAPGPWEEVTLVTCHPFYFVGPAPDRFLVKARRVAPDGSPYASSVAAPGPVAEPAGEVVSPRPRPGVVDCSAKRRGP